jgi:hypothetical protein
VSSNTLYRNFDKQELLSIADQLKIPVKGNPTSKGLCEYMSGVLDKGVPELGEVSDATFDFLVAGGWIDEDGNVLDVNLANAEVDDDDEEETYEIHEKESDVLVAEEIKLPQCYGLEDDRDPSCRRCKVKDACKVLRIANRPKCFGLMHDGKEPECQVCIEEASCAPISLAYQMKGRK